MVNPLKFLDEVGEAVGDFVQYVVKGLKHPDGTDVIVELPANISAEDARSILNDGIKSERIALAAELPMDTVSRESRRDLMGQSQGDDLYTGSTHDIREFRGDLSNPEGDWGQGTYATTSPEDASLNYAGEGPDLTARIESQADDLRMDLSNLDRQDLEREAVDAGVDHSGASDDDLAESVAYALAREQLVGDASGGVIYPLRKNMDNYATIGGPDSTRLEGKDYYAEARDTLERADYDNADDFEDAVTEAAQEIELYDEEGLYSQVRDALHNTDAWQEEDAIALVMEDVAEDIADGSLDLADLDKTVREHFTQVYTDNGDLVAPGGLSSQTLQNLGYDGVIDTQVNAKFGSGRQYGGGMQGLDLDTRHVITFPGKESNIRSPNATFDPRKASSGNILAGLGGAGIVAAGMAPEQAEAGPIKIAVDVGEGATDVAKRLYKTVIDTWHGTPHEFPPVHRVRDKKSGKSYYIDREDWQSHPVVKRNPEQFEHEQYFPEGAFDMSKIGTGEGSQAYGHGMYTAGARETGEGYRDTLQERAEVLFDGKSGQGGGTADEFYEAVFDADDLAGVEDRRNIDIADAWMQLQRYGSVDKALRAIQDLIPELDKFPSTQRSMQKQYEIIESNRDRFKVTQTKPGSLYNVQIDAHPDELLDWDKPLSEQQDVVDNVIASTGKSRDELLQLRIDNEKAAEAYLANPKDPELEAEWLRGHDDPDTKIGNLLYKIDHSLEPGWGGNAREPVTGEHLVDAVGKHDPEGLRRMGVKGIQYDDAMSRGAEGGTKNYVVFDDKLLNIVAKYGITPIAAASVLAGTMTVEEAQAANPVSAAWKARGVIAEKLATIPNLLRLDYLKPQYLNNPREVSGARTRYINSAKNNPAFLEREMKREKVPQVTTQHDIGMHREINPEEMVGKTGVPVSGDRSATGLDINSLGGVDFDVPVSVEGGSLFPLQREGTGLGWASMKEAAEKKQGNFRIAQWITDQEVLGVFTSLGEDAINFSTPIAQSMLKQVLGGPTSKTARKRFDDEFRRKFFKGWVGLDHPDAMDQLMGRNGYPDKGAGVRRTLFTTLLGAKRFENQGFPNYKEAVDAATHPELRDLEIGDAGFSMFHAEPDKPVVPGVSYHQSYDTAIPGRYAGGMKESLPPEIMYPDSWQHLSEKRIAKGEQKGQLLPRNQRTGSFMMNPELYQRFDQQWLDRVKEYTNSNPAQRKAILDEIEAVGMLSPDRMKKISSETGEIDPALLKFLAGSGALGLAAGAALRPEQAEASFLGTSAKTADKVSHAFAQKMEEAGVAAKEIWQKTGWGRGADGQWRFEVDDSQVVGNLTDKDWRIEDQVPLVGGPEAVITHPELEAAYPDLGKVPTRGEIGGTPDDAFVQGSYFPGEDGKKYDWEHPPPGQIMPSHEYAEVSGATGDQSNQVALHETQHGIQSREGFARGGSISEFNTQTDWYGLLEGQLGGFHKVLIDAGFPADVLINSPYQYRPMPNVDEYLNAVMQEAETRLGHVPKNVELAYYEAQKAANQSTLSPPEQYNNLAGEVESRNVEARRHMNPQERRTTPPEGMEDVPRSKQIVKFGNNPASSVFRPGSALTRKADFITNQNNASKIPATDQGQSLQETYLDYISDPIAQQEADSLGLALPELADKYRRDIASEVNDPNLDVNALLDTYSKTSGNFEAFLQSASKQPGEVAFQAKSLRNALGGGALAGLTGTTLASEQPPYQDRFDNPQNYGAIQNNDGTESTHRMAVEVDEQGQWHVFPTIVQMPDGSMHEFEDPHEAMAYNKSIGNTTPVPDLQTGLAFEKTLKTPEFNDYYAQQQDFPSLTPPQQDEGQYLSPDMQQYLANEDRGIEQGYVPPRGVQQPPPQPDVQQIAPGVELGLGIPSFGQVAAGRERDTIQAPISADLAHIADVVGRGEGILGRPLEETSRALEKLAYGEKLTKWERFLMAMEVPDGLVLPGLLGEMLKANRETERREDESYTSWY